MGFYGAFSKFSETSNLRSTILHIATAFPDSRQAPGTWIEMIVMASSHSQVLKTFPYAC
jgi:hypothetical protein